MNTWGSPGPGCEGRSKGTRGGKEGLDRLRESISFFRGEVGCHKTQEPGIILQLFASKGFWGEPALATETKRKVV